MHSTRLTRKMGTGQRPRPYTSASPYVRGLAAVAFKAFISALRVQKVKRIESIISGFRPQTAINPRPQPENAGFARFKAA